ncbi:EthD family reductase [Streptomyces mirabilis]|uniref:EthD family reductase n=1 Tax=Streptomyces mirabilis TaxID=68239 RepID=UPI0036401520
MTARFIVLYETPADPAAFDHHYRDIHLPIARRLPGLRRYTIGRDMVTIRGGEPYYLVAELEWDTMEELRAAFASPRRARHSNRLGPPSRPRPSPQHDLQGRRERAVGARTHH